MNIDFKKMLKRKTGENSMKWLRIIMPVLLIFTMFSCSSDKEGYRKAEDFTLTNGYGESFTLSEHKGKMVIINFWATWCPPCQREIPDFIELQDKYGKKGLVILGVSVDRDGWDVVDQYIQDKKIQYPVVMYTPEVIRAYDNFQSIPTTFIVDKKGRIVNKVTGYRPKTFWEEEIKKYL